MPASFTGQALTELRQVAHDDPRLAEAFHAALGTGEFAQVLAGGPWLIDFYTYGADPHTKAVVDASIDAWLLGHHTPLPAAMLEVAAAGYLDERERAVSVNWFDDALAQATTKIKGAVAPLTAVRTRRGAGAADGFLVADYLLQHASRSPRPPPPAHRTLGGASVPHGARGRSSAHRARRMKRGYGHQAVLHFRSAAEGSNVSDSPARQRDVPVLSHVGPASQADMAPVIELFDAHGHLAPLVLDHERISFNVYDESAGTPMRSGIISGDVAQSAQRGLAELLERAGHLDEATELQRHLAEQGDRSALGKLAELLERTGHIDEAVATWRSLAATDEMDDYPMRALTGLLARAGRIDEAVEVAQQLADSGYSYAIEELAELLENAGKLDEAIALWHALTQRDGVSAMHVLAALLGTGRIEGAGGVEKDAAEHGEAFGVEALAGVLERAGRVDEAAAAWQPATQGGDTYAVRMLAGLLLRAGRIDEAVALWEPAAEHGESSAIEALARLHEQAGRIDDAIATRQRLAASDETSDYPMRALAGLLERAGRADEAAAVWQRAGEHGDPLAMSGLAGLLERVGRTDEAAAVWRPAAQDRQYLRDARAGGAARRQAGPDEAAAVWQRAGEHGDPLAMSGLAGLLERVGRTDEAAAVWRPAAQDGNTYAMRALAALLERAGRTHEAVVSGTRGPARRHGRDAHARGEVPQQDWGNQHRRVVAARRGSTWSIRVVGGIGGAVASDRQGGRSRPGHGNRA